MPVRVTAWRGPQLTQIVRRELGNRLDTCVKLIHTDLVHSISTQGSYVPPVHSRPGDPPYRQTGELVASWQPELDRAGLVGRVSSDSPYVLQLEFGPTNPEPRPHGRRAFYSNIYTCRTILCAPL